MENLQPYAGMVALPQRYLQPITMRFSEERGLAVMSDQDETKHDNIRESWIESLLLSATKPQDNSDRLPQAMRQIDSDGSKNKLQTRKR